HLYSGYLNKEEQIIPYNKIQNINKKTTALHRLFHMTSLHFETAMSGDNATVVFNAISETQAAEIERLIERTTAEEEPIFSNEISVKAEEEANEEAERKVHFTRQHVILSEQLLLRSVFLYLFQFFFRFIQK